jgi:RNA polymerase sigma-70 factor (ECF subfamily)
MNGEATPRFDSDRVEQARRGDRRALESLLREVHPLVFNVCRRTLGDDADAADASQNALLNVARNIERFDGRSSFTTWVYRIAANAAIDEGRRRQRRRRRMVELDRDTADTALVEVTDSSAGVEDSDELATLLRQLPEEFKMAVVLRDVMDLDYDEIARILGVPGGTVRSRIARGRARLAELLGNQNPSEERPTRGRQT